jgi:hypothetical protein
MRFGENPITFMVSYIECYKRVVPHLGLIPPKVNLMSFCEPMLGGY